PPTSTSVADSITGAVFNYNLAQNGTYVIVADGIVSASGYNPAQPFDLKVYASGQEAAVTSGNTDILVHHGSTDAPTVDVDERNAGNLVDDASYGDFAGYLNLATADYILDVKDQGGTTTVASYDAPLATLGLDDSAIVVVASGFLDPTQNSNGPAFGLYVALPSGGSLIPLPINTSTSVSENEFSNSLSIYPNPTNQILNITGYDAELEVVITSVEGKIINNSRYNFASNAIDVSSLAKGMYYLRVTDTEGSIFTTQFIKQ
ncbi:MAG: T9SS type A sorting domain-containing protein, partial [Flavobacteriales bacterium]|nr:T9SS type A sorting domain-containing protein [Flavobacteriales bacterium]